MKEDSVKPPCQYSIGELKVRLRKSRQAAKNGAYKTQAEMKRKHAVRKVR